MNGNANFAFLPLGGDQRANLRSEDKCPRTTEPFKVAEKSLFVVGIRSTNNRLPPIFALGLVTSFGPPAMYAGAKYIVAIHSTVY